MGYQIVYDPSRQKQYPPAKNRRQTVQWGISIALLIVIILLCVSQPVSAALKHFLLPGDFEQTQAALSELVENLRSGETMKDSVTMFCLEILDGTAL